MPLIFLFLAGATGLYLVADWSAFWVGKEPLELSLRVVAAGVLVLHPWHEQRSGFREEFNRSLTKIVVMRHQHGEITAHWNDWPLSRTMNALQTALLITVFPLLALVGPWWVVLGMFAFYVGDITYTHREQGVPGEWSAWCGLVALGVLYVVLHKFPVTVQFGIVAAASIATGFLLLVLPWWMAHRRVKTS